MNVKIKPLPFFYIFLAIYSLVNVIGFANMNIYIEKYNNDKLIYLFFIGIAGLMVGTFFSRVLKVNYSKPKGSFKESRFVFYIFLINIVSILSIFYLHIKNGHILLFNNYSRFASFFIINVLVYASVILNITYVSHILLKNKPISKKLLLLIFIQSLFIISLAYRSPLVILFASIGVVFLVVRNDYQNKLKKILTIRNGIFFMFFIYIMSSISSYRVTQKYDFRKYYRNINMEFIDQHPNLKAYVPTISLFRYNQWVINKLIEKTENNHLNGALYMSNFAVLLPGSHLGARNIVGQIIEERKMPNGKPWSITPTLQGALFVDGGYNLVFFGFFLIAFILGVMNKIIKKHPTPFNLTIYAYLFISFLMSIHTGYLDFIFYLLLIGVSIFKFIIMRIKTIKIY
ncbi:MAG TPA: oligosaccharide repeat unit polymerase [Bacteroidia bacterium]|nr:oligosaccharide repeat unit polymerase [Bacteroidia bacterium]